MLDRTGYARHPGILDLGVHDLDAIGGELRAAAGAQIRRIQAVMTENAVHLMSGVVTRLRVVEHHHEPARAPSTSAAIRQPARRCEQRAATDEIRASLRS